MQTEVITPHVDSNMENLLTRLLTSQQPFFTSMMNQMEAIEGRLHAVDSRVGDIGMAVERIASAQLATQIAELNTRLDLLEKEQHKRQGIKELFDWSPKIIAMLALLVAAVLGYMKLKGQ